MILQKKAQYESDPGEVLDNTRITESAGYVPAKMRIEEMIVAGQRLVDFRRGKYDFPPGSDATEADQEAFVDVTRSTGFDMADASQMALQVADRLEEQAVAAVRKRKEAVEKPEKAKPETDEKVVPPKGD